jgi:molybdopterin/thiamine biosynthesis adenylyltransferase
VTVRLVKAAVTALRSVAKKFVEVALVVDAFCAANVVAVAFTKLDEVAKRLADVALVVEANVAARSVEVALVKVALVKFKLTPSNPEKNPVINVNPEPEIAVVEAFPR